MLHIVFKPETSFFSFIANKENGGVESDFIELSNQLLEITSGTFGLIAVTMPGKFEDAYLSVVGALEKMVKDKKINEAFDEIIEQNKSTIFINNETKEEAVKMMINEFKANKDETLDTQVEALRELDDNAPPREFLETLLTSRFLSLMQAGFDSSTKEVIEMLYQEEEEENSIDKYEEEL